MKKKFKHLKNEYQDFINSWEIFVQKHNKIFKILPHNLYLFVIFIFFILLCLSIIVNKSDVILYENNTSVNIEPALLVDEQVYPLDGISINKDINQICVKFFTYDRINNANYEFRIYQNDNLYYSQVFNSSAIKDNEYVCFDKLSIDYNVLSIYKMAIKPLYADDQNTISLYSNDENIALKLVNKGSIYSYKTLILFIGIILINVLCFIINLKKK